MNKIILFLLLLLLMSQQAAYASNITEIKRINKKVAQIEKAKAKLIILELKLTGVEIEGVPPQVKFYYQAEHGKIVVTEISVGHEVFSILHSYYFENNHIIKYLKVYDGSYTQPKGAVIYNKDGSVLWKNRPLPTVSAAKVLQLFKLNMKTIQDFSGY